MSYDTNPFASPANAIQDAMKMGGPAAQSGSNPAPTPSWATPQQVQSPMAGIANMFRALMAGSGQGANATGKPAGELPAPPLSPTPPPYQNGAPVPYQGGPWGAPSTADNSMSAMMTPPPV